MFSDIDIYLIISSLQDLGYGIPCKVFEKLVKSNDSMVRNTLASEGFIPSECGCDVYDKLAQDKESFIRDNLTTNWRIPAECRCDILRRLATDEELVIRASVVNVLHYVSTLHDECRCEILKQLMSDRNSGVKHKATMEYSRQGCE